MSRRRNDPIHNIIGIIGGTSKKAEKGIVKGVRVVVPNPKSLPHQGYPAGENPNKKPPKPKVAAPKVQGPGLGTYGPNDTIPSTKTKPVVKTTNTPKVTRGSGVRTGAPKAGSTRTTRPGTVTTTIKAPRVTANPTVTKPGPAAPPPVDPVAQQIAGTLQAAQRYTDYYDQQVLANQAATTANAQSLATAAGGLSSTVPSLGYVGAGTGPYVAQQANSYTDLINAVGQSDAKASAATNQAQIADSGSALQKYFGQVRAAQDMANAQFLTQTKASEPELRAKYASDQADLSMKLAEQQYLQDKLSLQGKQAAAANQLGYDRLNSANANSQANRDVKVAIAKQSAYTAAQKAQLAAATRGQAMSAAQRKVTQGWIDKHLFYKDPTSGAMTLNGDIPYTTILDQLGSLSGPAAAAQAAITYTGPSIRRDGINNFYAALTGHGISKRQAIKLLGAAGFNQSQINQIKRHGVASSGYQGGTTNVADIGGAVAGVVRAAGK